MLIKPNQARTVTEARAALDAGKRAGFATIVSARSGETEDISIAHRRQLERGSDQVGSLRAAADGEWNELLRIELGSGALRGRRRVIATQRGI